MVARTFEPQFTVEDEVKLRPLIVMVKAALPATAREGLRLVRTGAGGLTIKLAPGETPPTVLTVMLAVPGLAIRLAGTAAVSCVGLKLVVVSALPFHSAAEVAVKFLP